MIQIIYRKGLSEGSKIPYGIRDENGYLFFFADITKYPEQEKRYQKEIEDQLKLAEYLLSVLPVPHDWQSLDTEQKR